jgi:hypothetical protein
MHDCGLYSVEDMRPINEARMAARWKLGKALAAVERLPGGRGKKTSHDEKSFSNLLKALDLDKSVAIKAQRIPAHGLAAPALSEQREMRPRSGRAPRRDGAAAAAPDVAQVDEVDPLPIEPCHNGSGTPN